MDRIVIGLTGSLSAGKGTLANFLIDNGFRHQVLSDRIRDEIRSRGQEITRTLLQDVGNELRENFGGAVLAQRTAELLSDIKGNIVIDGVRNPEELLFLKHELGAMIIGVDAPKNKRLEWYLARAKERGEDGTTAEDFKKHDDRDFGIGEPGFGQQVKKCLDMADIVIWNNSTKKELCRELNFYLKEICGFDPEIRGDLLRRR